MWKRLGLFNLFSVIISEYISIDSITKDLMYSIHKLWFVMKHTSELLGYSKQKIYRAKMTY